MTFSKKKKMTKTTLAASKVPQKDYQGMIRRLSKKNLKSILLDKFLHHYGYDKGAVPAKALIEDIIATVDEFYVNANTLQPGQLVWLAADKDERGAKGKTLENTKKRTIKLTLFSPDDFELLTNKQSNFRDIQRRRTIRFIKEAYEQNTVLTLEELLILLAVNRVYLSDWIREHQRKSGKILPTRGNITDIGSGTTHKKIIVRLYCQGYLTPEIARKTNHSEEAVDRYIADFERIKALKEKKCTVEEMSFLTGRGLKIINEYLNILK